MDTGSLSRITNLPEYQELLKKRRQINTPIMVTILVSYFGFILLLAYEPRLHFLSQRIGDGVTTLGICLGVAIMLLTFALTGFYIFQTDKKVSDLLEKIRIKAGR